MVADNPEQKIAIKMFHSAIQNDHDAMAKEEAAYKPIPVVGYVSEETITETYEQIKDEIAALLKNELATWDKEDEEASPETDLEVNIPKPGLGKKQRRQMNKRQRQRERDDMRKIKQADDNKTSDNYAKPISTVKNDKIEHAMSM